MMFFFLFLLDFKYILSVINNEGKQNKGFLDYFVLMKYAILMSSN